MNKIYHEPDITQSALLSHLVLLRTLKVGTFYSIQVINEKIETPRNKITVQRHTDNK
jgi:hypothetical protein